MDSVNHTDSGDIQILFQFPGNSILNFCLDFFNCVGGTSFSGYFSGKTVVNHNLRLMSETSRVQAPSIDMVPPVQALNARFSIMTDNSQMIRLEPGSCCLQTLKFKEKCIVDLLQTRIMSNKPRHGKKPFIILTVNGRCATVCLTYKFFITSLLTSKVRTFMILSVARWRYWAIHNF